MWYNTYNEFREKVVGVWARIFVIPSMSSSKIPNSKPNGISSNLSVKSWEQSSRVGMNGILHKAARSSNWYCSGRHQPFWKRYRQSVSPYSEKIGGRTLEWASRLSSFPKGQAHSLTSDLPSNKVDLFCWPPEHQLSFLCWISFRTCSSIASISATFCPVGQGSFDMYAMTA